MNNDVTAVNLIAPFSERFLKMICVGDFDIDKIVPAIDVQRLNPQPVEPFSCRFDLFKHDQRCSRDYIASISKCTATGKPID